MDKDPKNRIFRELKTRPVAQPVISPHNTMKQPHALYDRFDLPLLQNLSLASPQQSALQTLDDLLERDEQREKDGFPKRIRIGRLVKPGKGKKNQIIIVPTTTEPKFYHDTSKSAEQEETTSGTGDGEEGEVIGEQPMRPQEGEGEGGEGAGQGDAAEHDVTSDAFDLGKILTEKFQLPNLKPKGKKKSFTKFIYDLTDRHRGFGQILDKKETLRRVIQTNILLGNLKAADTIVPEELVLNPFDRVYRIMSRERDFETQAIVFFVRDYSGSMTGPPTEVVATQHLFIYSWLAYQYKNNVESRFILHDTEAKEVPDFYTYHNSQIAGGTNVSPAYQMVIDIIVKEQLAKDYNIYVFHGTDGDDWESTGEKAVAAIKEILRYTSRMGITVARNTWGAGAGSESTLEKYINGSGILKQYPDLIRMDSFPAADAAEQRIIESIKKLVDDH
ncbi:MAG: DUF444 family protein [bacterium]